MVVQFRPRTIPSDEELEFLNARNPALRFERSLDGELVVSPLCGYESGLQKVELVGQVANWNSKFGHGKVIGSSTGISIGLSGMPDAGWLSGARDRSVPKDQRKKFLRVAPELVFELISPSDTAAAVARRAGEWVAAGVDMPVVLDPSKRVAVVYNERGAGEPRTPTLVIDKARLPGAERDLVIDLDAVFDAG
jgi:Uma2 family endonuclease